MPHRRLEMRVETGPLDDGVSRALAVTVHLPEFAGDQTGAPVVVSLPGGGYNRRYFDLTEAGYSEAAHRVGRGVIVIAIDHLGVGESDIPDLAELSLEAVAEADHAALQVVLQRLRDGKLTTDLPAIRPTVVIGEGQSMGGHVALLMQAHHRCFDGLAMLGSSVVCTRLRAPRTVDDICLIGKRDPAEGLAMLRNLDWRFAFHWDDVPDRFADVDSAAKNGAGPLPYWGSATAPNAANALLPGYYAREAASVNVPVLVGMGERDVCQDPLRELAAYVSARDIALLVCPRMGHMHNFAGTRAMLWNRLDAFIAQVEACAS